MPLSSSQKYLVLAFGSWSALIAVALILATGLALLVAALL